MRYQIVADGELADDEAAQRTVGAIMRLFELGALVTVTAGRDGVGVVAEARLGRPEMAAAADPGPEMAAGPETDYDDLRRRLEDVKLAGTRLTTGYRFRSNEAAALQAVAVVRDWLGVPAWDPEDRRGLWEDPGKVREADG